MPHKYDVNGTVKSTMPLNYGGSVIDNFSLTFKDGKVVDFEAEQGKETLKHLLDTDEGAKDRKSTRLNSSHVAISYAVFCLKKKKKNKQTIPAPDVKRAKGNTNEDDSKICTTSATIAAPTE